MFFSRGSLGSVEFAFTNRAGGHSTGPYASLNLGSAAAGADADDPAVVRRNLGTLADALGIAKVLTMSQVHGAEIAYVDSADAEIPVADAMITDVTGLGLVVRVADCTPIVLADPSARLIGVVHAGRAGLANGITPATVRAMRQRGATRIQAWLGPRVCGACYELPPDLVDTIAAAVPEARATTRAGTPSLDVGAGIVAQLRTEDVNVTDLGAGECTLEDDTFFSYRRQGVKSGRQGAIAVLHPANT